MQETPWVVEENAPVKEVMQKMVDKKVGGIPVVDHNMHVTGFISDGDIMRYIANTTSAVSSNYAILEFVKNQTIDQKVAELLTQDAATIATNKVICLNVNQTVEEALDLLSSHKIKKLPVLDDGKIIGTLNRSDILRYIMQSSLS